MRMTLIILILLFAPAGWAVGQSSSLYKAHRMRVVKKEAATTRPSTNGSLRSNAGTAVQPVVPRNKALAAASLTAVSPPEPPLIKVHDHIGVIVRHSYTAKSDAKLAQGSEWDVNSKLEAWFRIHNKKLQQQNFGGGTPNVSFTNKNELENKGKADRSDIIETRLMGKVIDVKPNGNLTIVGWYDMTPGEDSQRVVLTGEVNSREISADRTVTSDRIFGLRFAEVAKGAIADTVKRGWLKTALDAIKPF